MKKTELQETVASLASLLKHTTEKRLVYPPKTDKEIAEETGQFYLAMQGQSHCFSETSEPGIEYYNVLFSPEQVEVIKRKFLKLVEEL